LRFDFDRRFDLVWPFLDVLRWGARACVADAALSGVAPATTVGDGNSLRSAIPHRLDAMN